MFKIRLNKSKKLKSIATFITFIVSLSGIKAQDAIFSQFYNKNLYFNPAFAGMIKTASVSGVYRSQSIGAFNVPGFISIGAEYQQPSNFLHGGAGFQILKDMQAGNALSRTVASFIYSYRLSASDKVNVYSGFEATVGQNSLNQTNFVFPDMVGNFPAPPENIANSAKIFADFSVGFIGKYNGSFLGIAVDHLTEPNISFNGNEQLLYRKFTAIAGTKINLDNRRSIQEPPSIEPEILFQSQESYQLLTEGAIVNYSPFFFGIYVRENSHFQLKALVFAIGINYANASFSYSYDLGVGKTSLPGYIAHEVTFSYKFKYNEKRKKRTQ